jgi:hypothetical protein
MERYGTARQAADDNIILRTRFACWIPKAADTLRMCYFFHFSTVKMVTTTRLNVTFICTLPVFFNIIFPSPLPTNIFWVLLFWTKNNRQSYLSVFLRPIGDVNFFKLTNSWHYRNSFLSCFIRKLRFISLPQVHSFVTYCV